MIYHFFVLYHALRDHTVVPRWGTPCWKPCHLNCKEFYLSCLRFNAPFFLQTKTLQNKMLKLTSRNISSTWQAQSTLLKEWVWTIDLAIQLLFKKHWQKVSDAFAKRRGRWDHATPPKKYCGLPKINIFDTNSQVELQKRKHKLLEILPSKLCRVTLKMFGGQRTICSTY